MSIIKFAFISAFFLLSKNLCAQQSAASTTTYDIKDIGSSTHVLSRLHTTEDKNAFRQWGRPIDTVYTYKKITVEDLSPYVNESFFDSVIAYYNASNFEAMLFTNIDSIEPDEKKIREDYYRLFRKTYGIIQSKTVLKREVFTSVNNDKYVIITYSGIFKTMQGQFSIGVNVTHKARPCLVDMLCTPYDYSNISFFSNISSLALEYIKAKNINTLMDEASRDIQQRIVNKKKLRESLEAINCDSLKQFTSNLILQGSATYARVVYDMPNEDKYFSLVFVSDKKKFILYDLGFINKKGK